MNADDFAPLNIDPRRIDLGGEVPPSQWRPFSPAQQRILRGMMAGRVIRKDKQKVKNGRVLPSWLDLFPTVEEAQRVLGQEVLDDVLALTVDHSNVKIAGVNPRLDRVSTVGYRTIGKAETLLQQMPSQFTWADLMAARDGSTKEISRMSRKSIAVTVYCHIVAGNIEHIENAVDLSNPTLIKRSPYLDPAAL